MVRSVDSRSGFFQPIPSGTIANCAGVRISPAVRADDQARRSCFNSIVIGNSLLPQLQVTRPQKRVTWQDIRLLFHDVCTFVGE